MAKTKGNTDRRYAAPWYKALMAAGANKDERVQHTPGPWHVGMKPGPMVYGTRGEQVADCRGMLPDSECRHNARLIAAAPEMLALLQSIHGCVVWDETKDAPMRVLDGEQERALASLLARIEGR